ERLACNEEDVGSTPTVSTRASVVSTAARARRKAEVWVRLLPEAPFYARSSVAERCSDKAEDAGSSPAERISRTELSRKRTGAPLRRGPFDPGRPLHKSVV